MDEPTTALSGSDVKRVFSVIADLRKQGKSILYISHDLDEIAEIADRVTVIRDGEYIGTVQVRDVQISDIVKMIVGRELKTGYPEISNHKDDEVLHVDSLTGSSESFQDVSFRITKGEILGITGLLGCGATEIARVLFGVKNFESGKNSTLDTFLKIAKHFDLMDDFYRALNSIADTNNKESMY